MPNSNLDEPNPEAVERSALHRWLPPAALSRQRLAVTGLLLALAILTFFTILQQNPYAVDWHFTYRPATLTILRAQNPYATEDVLPFGPPWTIIPLIPFAILPEPIGRSLFAVASMGLLAYSAIRMGAKPLGLLAFLLSVPVASSLQAGNIEALVLLGVILPPQIGLLFLAMKPQETAAVILLVAVQAWRQGGLRQTVRQFWPLVTLTVLSLVIFPWWPLRWLDASNVAGYFNVSLWPHSIPIGLTLLVIALRDQELKHAMLASPFLSPYTIITNWAGAVLALAPSTLEIVVASIGTWIFWALFYLLNG